MTEAGWTVSVSSPVTLEKGPGTWSEEDLESEYRTSRGFVGRMTPMSLSRLCV